jgi:hypothetical protein
MIQNLFDNKKSIEYWVKTFETMKKQLINTWDYQWTFTLWNNNMIENVGCYAYNWGE